LKPHLQFVDHPTPEPDYTAALKLRLTRELAERGPLGFQELVEDAEGAYPSDVLSALRALQEDGQAFLLPSAKWSKTESSSQPVVHRSSNTRQTRAASSDGLPEPHPVDFDWRFTTKTLADLGKYINASELENVAVLGAPTLYRYLRDSGINAHLFDKNPYIVRHFKATGYSTVTQSDLFKFSDFSAQFQWAIADPPWYIEHYYAFLKAGSKLLAKEGKLLLSVLPRLTRLSAPRDRLNIIELAGKFGFDLTEVRPAALRYASPPFEIEALHAEGLALDDWRTGDIFCFTLRCHPLQEPEPHKPTDEDNWHVFQLGTTIVKIKDEQRLESEAFDYRPVSPTGSVRLRSVSRRSPVRSKINLWTSRNIALAVSKPGALSEALEKLRNGHPLNRTLASTAYEYQLNSDEVNKLQEVLELLSKDAGLIWSD
jgi:Probable N6-adenine methyltransferase